MSDTRGYRPLLLALFRFLSKLLKLCTEWDVGESASVLLKADTADMSAAIRSVCAGVWRSFFSGFDSHVACPCLARGRLHTRL